MLVKILQYDKKEELKAVYFCKVKAFYETKELLYTFGHKNIKYYNVMYLINPILDLKFYPYKIRFKDFNDELNKYESINKTKEDYHKIKIIYLNDIK